MPRGRFRNARLHDPHAPSSTRKACKIYWFSLRLKHIKKFEAISKQRRLTGQGLEAHFQNSPKKFNVFLAWFYWCFVNFEQRHRGRSAKNGRATARETYYMFCKNEQRHRRRKLFFLRRAKAILHDLIALGNSTRTSAFVKTTADERQLSRPGPSRPRRVKKNWKGVAAEKLTEKEYWQAYGERSNRTFEP